VATAAMTPDRILLKAFLQIFVFDVTMRRRQPLTL
jgi:hypothetical protein